MLTKANMKRTLTVNSSSYISLVCYTLVGRSITDIKFDYLDFLCTQALENYNKKPNPAKIKIVYTRLSLQRYINMFSTTENVQHIQLFKRQTNQDEKIYFIDDLSLILERLSRLISNIPHNIFIDLYSFVNEYVNQYVLLMSL